jgi:hypothetical protein
LGKHLKLYNEKNPHNIPTEFKRHGMSLELALGSVRLHTTHLCTHAHTGSLMGAGVFKTGPRLSMEMRTKSTKMREAAFGQTEAR